MHMNISNRLPLLWQQPLVLCASPQPSAYAAPPSLCAAEPPAVRVLDAPSQLLQQLLDLALAQTLTPPASMVNDQILVNSCMLSFLLCTCCSIFWIWLRLRLRFSLLLQS